MIEKLFSVLAVVGWALLGAMAHRGPVWFGALVGGAFEATMVCAYWADRGEREAAGRT